MKDYHNTAYIIAGSAEQGTILYYYFDYETGEWDWTKYAFEASPFSTIEQVETFKKYVRSDSDYSRVKKIWIEELSTKPIEGTAEEL